MADEIALGDMDDDAAEAASDADDDDADAASDADDSVTEYFSY